MAIFLVTLDNWNDPGFWSTVTTGAESNMLDFSALPESFTITFARDGAFLTLFDGADSFTIGEDSGGDATLGTPGEFGLFELVAGSAGDDLIDGNDAADTLSGGAGDDSLLGYGGDDSLTGGDGADTLRGGMGADTLLGDAGDDVIYGNEGNDSLIGGDGADSIYGETGDDYVEGGAGDDHLEGNEGNDTLIGGDGNDWMRGSYGNDALWGGAGDDYLWGGYGDDTFHIENGFGNDTVDAEDMDETEGDLLDLSAVTDGLRIDMRSADPKSGSVSDGSSTLVFDAVERVLLGAGNDTIALADYGGLDSVTGFAAPELQGDGSYLARDTLDVSALTDWDGNPVDTADVTVSDTIGDGSGDAVLSFPGGEAITLVGVSVEAVSTPAQLAALGIPAADAVEEGEEPAADTPSGEDDAEGETDAIELPQIDGAFEFEATLRVDDLAAGNGQTVFEYGGGGANAITFGQLGPSSAMMLEIVQDGVTHYVVAEDALVAGETATWTVGIDETGQMYIDKDGATLIEGEGVVPADVERLPALLGDSAVVTRSTFGGEITDVSLAQGDTIWSPSDEDPTETETEDAPEATEDTPAPDATVDDTAPEAPVDDIEEEENESPEPPQTGLSSPSEDAAEEEATDEEASEDHREHEALSEFFASLFQWGPHAHGDRDAAEEEDEEDDGPDSVFGKLWSFFGSLFG